MKTHRHLWLLFLKQLLAILLVGCVEMAQAQTTVGNYGRAITQVSVAALTITTTSPLPSGTSGVNYGPVTVTATGGVLPYAWTCPATCNLPTGLSIAGLTGAISGNTTVVGTTNNVIQVCDSASPSPNCKTKTLQITINASGGGPSGVAITACDPTVTPESSGGAGTKLTANAGTYYFANDLSCTGNGVSLQNNNITLNAHGHTLTYATSAQTTPKFGIVGIGCAEGDATAGQCGGNFKSPTIYSDTAGGTITQGSGAAGLSDGIRIGGNANGSQCGGGLIHDITIFISRPTGTTNPGQKASRSIAFRYCQAALTIGPNVVTHNTEMWVQNRTSIEGPDIRLENWSGSSGALTVVGPNNISGSGQGGIYHGESWNSIIHDSTVGGNGHVVQDFEIFAWGTNDEVYNMTATCISCRGLFVAGHDFHPPSATGQHIHDNNITTTMLQQYCPDGASCPSTASWGCQNHGTYALQFDDGAGGALVENNVFTAHADPVGACNATAVRVSGIVSGNLTRNNQFFSLRDSGAPTGLSFGYGTEATQTGVFNSQDDFWQADTAIFFADWLGNPAGAVYLRPTIKKGTNADPGFVVFSFKNGDGSNCNSPSQCGAHFTLIDPTFQNGATKDSNNMSTLGGGGSGGGPGEYLIQRTFLPLVQCAIGSGSCTPGTPITAALVSVNDLSAANVFSGTTDASGHINAGAGVVLTEFRRANCGVFGAGGKSCSSGGGAVFKEMHTPHSITISKAGCTTLTPTLDLTTITNGTAAVTYNLSCP